MIDQNREAELRGAIEDLFFGYRVFTALPDRILAERGLGRTHHRLLYFVRREPGIAVGELLSVLGVTKQAVHRPIRELVDQQLLTIAADREDRRIRRLSVTPAGRELEEQLTAAQMALLDEAFEKAGSGAEKAWRSVMGELRSGL